MLNEETYKRFIIVGLAVANAIIKNYHDSEEMVSQTFITLLNQDNKKIDNFEQYFKKIVRNNSIKFIKDKKKENRVKEEHKIEKKLEQFEDNFEESTKGLHWKTIYSYLNEKEKQLYKDWKKFQNSKEIGEKQNKSVKTIRTQISYLKQTLSAIRFKTNSEIGGSIKQLTYNEYKNLKNFINRTLELVKDKNYSKQASKHYYANVDIKQIPDFDKFESYEIRREGNNYIIAFGCLKNSLPVIWLMKFFFARNNRIKVTEIITKVKFVEIKREDLLTPNPKTMIIPQKFGEN